MRIGLNLLYLIPGSVGGVETYATLLIKSLSQIDHKNKYFIFLNQESKDLKFSNQHNFHRIICDFHATSRPIRYAWEQFVLPLQLKKYRIDIVHSLSYVGPLVSPCARIVTIPDLNYITLSHTIPKSRCYALRFFSTQAAHRSNHVITISDFSKREITQKLHLSANKVTVTHLGPGWDFTSSSSVDWEVIQQKYPLPPSYIVAFSREDPHKNIPFLVDAFYQINKNYPGFLVIIGKLPKSVSLEARYHEIQNRIIELGYVSTPHLMPILNHADLFVLPSLYEGFGMPVLEAQKAGVALACSNAASLPEIAGDGAVFFDPHSVKEIKSALLKCLSNNTLRSNLVDLGYRNLNRFSWMSTANGTMDVYKKVLSN